MVADRLKKLPLPLSLSLSLSPLFPFRDSVVEAAAAALMANQDFDPADFNEAMAAAADATGVVDRGRWPGPGPFCCGAEVPVPK